MCLGVPMQVQSVPSWGIAVCHTGAEGAQPQRIETSLLLQVPDIGDWLLVHVNIAIRALDSNEARQISDALLAVDRAATGESFEYLLADLIDREPQLPPHLQAQAEAEAVTDNEQTVISNE